MPKFMEKKRSIAPIATIAIAVVLIVGVSALLMRPRTTVAAASLPIEPAVVVPESPSDFPRDQGQAVSQANGLDQQDLMNAHLENASRVAAIGDRKLRSQFEEEQVDTGWAARKQQALEQLSISPQIIQVNAQPLSITARCRSTVCLIDADFPSQLAAVDWHTLYTLNAGKEMSNSSMRSTMNPDGSVHLEIYGLARQ